MELVVFSLVALLAGGVFVALRAVRLAAGRWWRGIGTLVGVACGAALVAGVALVLRRVDLVMSSRVAGIEPESLAATIERVAAVQDLWLFDTALFVVLGVLQGAALGLALSLAIEPDAPALDSAFRVRTWRAALGKAVVTLPLPAALAVLLTFYEDNRDRFSSVGVGGFLTLALSPAPAGGSQQSAPAGDGGGGGGLLYSTYTYVDRAQQSLNGELRRRDFAFIEAMALQAPHGGRSGARVPDAEADYEQTLRLERWNCGWLNYLRDYVRVFEDYNLLTLNVGDALSKLQIGWELEKRELREWAAAIEREVGSKPFGAIRFPTAEVNKISSHDSAGRLLASNEVFEQLNKRARTALIQVGAGGSYEDRTRAPNCEAPRQDGPAEPAPALGARKQADPAAGSDAPASGASRDDPPPVRQQMAYASPAPGVPPAGAAADPSEADSHGWGADRTKRRILDLHAPYRAIGTANFYAAIGSFETAYLVLRDWLALDIALRRSAPALDEALPRWFRVRVLQEAAEMYRNTSSEARLSERFRRQLDEVVREYRRVVPGPLPERGAGAAWCSGAPTGAARYPIDLNPMAAVTLARVTSEIEYLDVSGLAGSVSQRHVEDAKALLRLDFPCFDRAFDAGLPRTEAQAILSLYEARAIIAWGRLAIRWAEAERASKRVSDDERKRTLAEVRVAVGGVVERLEHRARVEDEERLGRAASDTRHDGGSTLVHARAARRVLQEVLALDRGA